MQIIIKKDLTLNTTQVINILYGEYDIYTENWIKNYIENYITNEIDSSQFSFEQNKDIYTISKLSKITSKGYIYNTQKNIIKHIFSIQYLTFDNLNSPLIENQNNQLWNNINSEINHNVMKRIDHDSLYNINLKFDAIIKTKSSWNTTELVMIQNDITKNYKRELYSSIVKKMKRFEKKMLFKNNKSNKKANLSCKTIMIDETGALQGCGNGIPNVNKFFDEVEFTIINN